MYHWGIFDLFGSLPRIPRTKVSWSHFFHLPDKIHIILIKEKDICMLSKLLFCNIYDLSQCCECSKYGNTKCFFSCKNGKMITIFWDIWCASSQNCFQKNTILCCFHYKICYCLVVWIFWWHSLEAKKEKQYLFYDMGCWSKWGSKTEHSKSFVHITEENLQ